MTATAVRTATAPRSVVDDLRARLDAERRAVTEEAEAFDAFIQRAEAIDPARPVPAGGVHTVDRGGRSAGLEAIRSAYEATVMSVSHYDEEYGDTYRESVVAEFGPEIGTALTEGQRLQPHLKQAVAERAKRCRTDRQRFLEMLKTEAESIETVGSGLRDIRTELETFDADPPSTDGYGALEAEWRRLDLLGEQIDGFAADRQRTIIRQRRTFTGLTSAPDVPTYLYQERDEEYPLLSECVELRKLVRTRRSERERALAGV
jgi:hypothetical protein